MLVPERRSYVRYQFPAFPIARLAIDTDIQFLQGTDIKTGNVFCIVCDDFVYDSAFSDIHSSISIAVEETVTNFQGLFLPTP